jgi:sulfatase maturation enzyme AslB (radical SAM superfamily)
VALITNGGLLNKEKCKVLAEELSYIRFSIDAGCSATHARLHKSRNPLNDNYEKIMENIVHLVTWKRKLKKKIKIGAGYLVHPENTQEIFSLVAKMKEIGVDYVQIRPICTLTREERVLITNESKRQIEHSLKLMDENFHVFPILHRFDEIMSFERGYDTCYGHALIGIIGADCKVHLCCQLKGKKKYVMGDLHENSFKDVWEGEQRKDVIHGLAVNDCPPCRYNKYNEILDYMADREKLHIDFL